MSKENNFWHLRNQYETSYFYTIHRARVTDIHLTKGTVNVSIEGQPSTREVTIPLMGLSFPPKDSDSDKNYKRTSWGRYIPQKGDMILIGFSSTGEIHSLGYTAVYYDGLGGWDDATEDRGGIGWSSASGKTLKPGDWDFKSARNCGLYMGGKAVLNSGPLTTTWDKDQNFIASKAGLIQDNFGEASETRKGVARRRVLPTDSEETEIISTRGTTCQELTDVVSYSVLGVPTELARTSIGDVVDEQTFLPKVSSTAAQPVRKYEAYSDLAGALVVSETEIDVLGNFSQSSSTATIYQWDTQLSSWTIDNLNTTWNSTVKFEISSPLFIIDSPSIQLGSSSATSFALKGTEFISFLSTFCTTMIPLATAAGTAATPIPADIVKLASAWNTLSIQLTQLAAKLSSFLAVKVKVE